MHLIFRSKMLQLRTWPIGQRQRVDHGVQIRVEGLSICVKFICMEQLRIHLRRGPSPVTSCRDILPKVDLQNLTNIAAIAILCNTHRQLQASLFPKIIIEVEVLKVNTGIIWHHIGISLILAISFQYFQHWVPLSPKKSPTDPAAMHPLPSRCLWANAKNPATQSVRENTQGRLLQSPRHQSAKTLAHHGY